MHHSTPDRAPGRGAGGKIAANLTTQYREEADRLADLVRIILAGRIVAEDTPAAHKAEVAAPTST